MIQIGIVRHLLMILIVVHHQIRCWLLNRLLHLVRILLLPILSLLLPAGATPLRSLLRLILLVVLSLATWRSVVIICNSLTAVYFFFFYLLLALHVTDLLHVGVWNHLLALISHLENEDNILYYMLLRLRALLRLLLLLQDLEILGLLRELLSILALIVLRIGSHTLELLLCLVLLAFV